tara:strand:- start:213 stop:9071 length:8859 start_codon:yes stop_codon:yes gene_type:complete
MDPSLEFKFQLYKSQPNYFNDDELDLLKTQLSEAGIDKGVLDEIKHTGNGRDSNFSIGRTLANFMEGTVEGATTLSLGVTEPKNTADTIARSLGNLGGFVGTVFTPIKPLVAGLNLAAKGAKAVKLGKTAATITKAEKGITNSRLLKKLNLIDDQGKARAGYDISGVSIPKIASRYVMEGKPSGVLSFLPKFKGMDARLKEMEKSYKWMQKSNEIPKIIHEAINLGVMSGASTMTVNPFSWDDNIGESGKSILHGAVAGGAFGAIGAINIGKALKSSTSSVRKAAEGTVKAAAGAGVQGLIMNSSLPDDYEIPLGEEVYEYMLGAYFGFNAATANQRAFQSEVKPTMDKAILQKKPLKEALKETKYNKELRKKATEYYNSIKFSDASITEYIINKKRGDTGISLDDYMDVRVTSKGKYTNKTGKLMSATKRKDGKHAIDINGKTVWLKNTSFEFKKSTQDEKYYSKGDTLSKQESRQQSKTLEDLENEYFVPEESLATNAEKVVSNIQKVLGKNNIEKLNERELRDFISESLENKSVKDADSVIEKIMSIPELQELGDIGRNSFKKDIRKHLNAKKNMRTIPQLHTNYSLIGSEPILSPAPFMDAKGRVIQEKNNTRTSWESTNVIKNQTELFPEKLNWNYYEITSEQGLKSIGNKSVKNISPSVFNERFQYDQKSWNNPKFNSSRESFHKKQFEMSMDGKLNLGGGGSKDRIVLTDLQYSPQPAPDQINAPAKYIREQLSKTKEGVKQLSDLNKLRKTYIKEGNLALKSIMANQGGAKYMNVQQPEVALRYQYENAVASKMKWLEQVNGGVSYGEMMAANAKAIKQNKKELPFLNNVIDLNKRLTLIHAMETPWTPELFNGINDLIGGELNISLVRDSSPKIKSTNLNGKLLDNHYDGIHTLRQDIFDAAVKSNGLPENISSAKGTLYSPNIRLGALLGKYAYVRANDAVNKQMVKNQVHGELEATSIKQLGKREISSVKYDKKTDTDTYFDSKGKPLRGAPTVRIPIEHYKMNPGPTENPTHNLKNQTSVLQGQEWNFNTYLNKGVVKNPDGTTRPYTTKDNRLEYDVLTEKNFVGSKELNDIVQKKNLSIDEIKRIEEVDINDIGMSEVIKAATDPTVNLKVYREIWKKLLNQSDNLGEFLSDNVLSKNDKIGIEDMMKYRSMSEKILKSGRLTPGVINHKWVKEYSNMVLRSYALKKLNKPIEDQSSKHIAIPYDRYMQANPKMKLNPGEIFYGTDVGKKKVKVSGKEYTLKEVLDLRNSLEKSLEKVKGTKNEKGVQEQLEYLNDKLEVVSVKVPSDNFSGQRVLKIKDFLKDVKGTGVIIHPEDMHYQAGMDLDIDSVFHYHGRSAGYKSAVKNKKNKHMHGGSFDPTGAESQKRWVDPKGINGISPNVLKNNPSLMLDPLVSEQVSRNAYNNNQNLGIAVSEGSTLARALDVINTQSSKRTYSVSFGSQNDAKIRTGSDYTLSELMSGAKVRLVSKKGSLERFSKIVSESVNMYADAGKFGKLYGKDALLEKLWKFSEIDVIGVMSNNKPIPQHLKREFFKGTVFGSATAFKQSLKGAKYINNIKKQLTISDVKKQADEYIRHLEADNLQEIMPGALQSKARRLTIMEDLPTATLGHISGEKYVNLLKKVNETVSERYSDEGIKKAIESFSENKLPKEIKSRENPNEYKDFISNDIDFATTFLKLEKTFKKIEKAIPDITKSEQVIKRIMDETFQAASENQVAWQLEKNEAFRQKVTNKGGNYVVEAVRESIKKTAQEFEEMFETSKTLTSPQKKQLGKLAKDVFYHALGSNIVLGRNQLRDNILKEKTGLSKDETVGISVGMNTGKANLDLLYTLDVIPAKYLVEHFNTREKVEHSITKTEFQEGSTKQDPVDFIMSDKPIPRGTPKNEYSVERENRQNLANAIYNYESESVKKKIYNKIDKQLPKTPHTKKLIRDLEILFEAQPTILEQFEKVFPSVTAKPRSSTMLGAEIGVDLKNATNADIRGFINKFKAPMTEEQWTRYGKGESIKVPVKRNSFWRFSETTTDKLASSDVTFFPKKGFVERGGKIVPVDVLKPMSRFEKMSDNNVIISELSTGLQDQFGNLFEKSFGLIKNMDNRMIKAFEEALVGKIEARLLTNTKSKVKRKKTYEDGEKFTRDFLEKFGKQRVSVIVGNKSKSLPIKDVLNIVENKTIKVLKDIHSNIVTSKLPWTDFIMYKKGFPSIEETVKQRINPTIEDPSYRESIKLDSYNISPGLSIENIMKTLELMKIHNKTITHKGKDVLMGDLRKIDPDFYTKLFFKGFKNKAGKKIPSILERIDKEGNIGNKGDAYFPHIGHPKAVMKEFITKEAKRKGRGNVKVSEEEMTRLQLDYLGRNRADGGAMMPHESVILTQGSINKNNRHIHNAQALTPNLKKRTEDLPHYLKNINVVSTYANQQIKLRFNAMMALSNSVTIKNFDKAKNLNGTPLMGSAKNQEHWGRLMRLISLKDNGGSHVIPEQWLKDKDFKIARAYKHLTEGEMYKNAKKIGKFFGNENLLLAKDLAGDHTIAANNARLNWLANLEAKISTSTLLMNTRGVTYNIVGGSINTVINTGFDKFKKSFDYDYLRKAIPDPEFKKGQIDSRGRDWFVEFAKKHGVIETFWTNELAGNPAFKSLRGKVKQGEDVFSKGLFRDLVNAASIPGISKNNAKDRRNMRETLSKYGIDAKANELGGWFMKTAEVELRLRGFLAHYLKAKEVFDSKGVTFEAEDPFLIETALRGVTGTQYLYNNPGRPMVAGSPIGRIFSRFQLWTANSLRMRKDIFRIARDAGFEKDSEEHKKFERMLTADMFMFSMATLLPYSMFDATLPPPYNYYQEVSNVLYGSQQEKERAFFGALPYPLNITGLVTPPSGRYITQPLGNLMSGDWDRFWDYQIYSWFPGGMLMKTAKDVVNEPIKAVDKITGFPLYRLNYMSKDKEKEEKENNE